MSTLLKDGKKNGPEKVTILDAGHAGIGEAAKSRRFDMIIQEPKDIGTRECLVCPNCISTSFAYYEGDIFHCVECGEWIFINDNYWCSPKLPDPEIIVKET